MGSTPVDMRGDNKIQILIKNSSLARKNSATWVN